MAQTPSDPLVICVVPPVRVSSVAIQSPVRLTSAAFGAYKRNVTVWSA